MSPSVSFKNTIKGPSRRNVYSAVANHLNAVFSKQLLHLKVGNVVQAYYSRTPRRILECHSDITTSLAAEAVPQTGCGQWVNTIDVDAFITTAIASTLRFEPRYLQGMD